MCLMKGAFVGEQNFDVIKMHGTTIKNILLLFITFKTLDKWRTFNSAQRNEALHGYQL